MYRGCRVAGRWRRQAQLQPRQPVAGKLRGQAAATGARRASGGGSQRTPAELPAHRACCRSRRAGTGPSRASSRPTAACVAVRRRRGAAAASRVRTEARRVAAHAPCWRPCRTGITAAREACRVWFKTHQLRQACLSCHGSLQAAKAKRRERGAEGSRRRRQPARRAARPASTRRRGPTLRNSHQAFQRRAAQPQSPLAPHAGTARSRVPRSIHSPEGEGAQAHSSRRRRRRGPRRRSSTRRPSAGRSTGPRRTTCLHEKHGETMKLGGGRTPRRNWCLASQPLPALDGGRRADAPAQHALRQRRLTERQEPSHQAQHPLRSAHGFL